MNLKVILKAAKLSEEPGQGRGGGGGGHSL